MRLYASVLIIVVMSMLVTTRCFIRRSMSATPIVSLVKMKPFIRMRSHISFDKSLHKSFFKEIGEKNFDGMQKVYEEMVRISPVDANQKIYVCAILNICEELNQLKYAEKLINNLVKTGVPLDDSMILPRIRIKCANGKPGEALKIIEDASSSLTPRLRNFVPIIDHYCSLLSVKGTKKAMDVARLLPKYNLYPRREQVLSILRSAAAAGILRRHDFLEGLAEILATYKKHHYGLMQSDAVEIVKLFKNTSSADVEARGVLIGDIRGVDGRVVPEDRGKEKGMVRVLMHNHVGIGESPAAATKDTLHATPTEYPPFGKSVIKGPQLYAIRGKYGAAPEEVARIVHIAPNHPGECPNCNMHLSGSMIEEWEESRDAVKKGMIDYLRASKSEQVRVRFEEFAHWLEAYNIQYDYVIDGANVAYFGQNVADGDFSFAQIDAVYETVKKSSRGADTKILVVLPQVYTKELRPNSVRFGHSTRITLSDRKILSKFDKEGSLFLVPAGGDDDLYAIYASLCHPYSRRNNTFMVTNDQMRNHKLLAFVQSRFFYRWRGIHQVQFSIHDNRKDSMADNIRLIHPAPFVREIYRDDKMPNRWHFPIVDRRSWLCLNIPNTLPPDYVE